MIDYDQLDWAQRNWLVYPTGSRAICNPPPIDQSRDEDFIAYFPDVDEIQRHLQSLGFWCESSDDYNGAKSVFYSWKKNYGGGYWRPTTNVLVTQDLDFYKDFVYATNLATKMNLMYREERVKLFKAVLYGPSRDIIFTTHFGDYMRSQDEQPSQDVRSGEPDFLGIPLDE